MDASEINSIAKRITQQWIAMIQSRVSRPSNASSKAFLNQLEANGRVVFKYQDRDLLDKALEYIPLQRLYDEAEAILEQTEGSLEDVVIQRLLHWFKHEFFSWVNNAPCDYCSSTQTKSNGLTQPSQEDLRYGAHVVETYQCLSCHQITRFPRYNDPGKLLETRRGRCGEWANCFTLCCHAVGSEARIIYDTTDHVWTEVYSEHEQRWVHCDACEEAWDRPLLYSMGWNKKLSYCTAFSIDEAIDVTKRYTRNWPEVLKRRDKISELELSKLLDEITAKRQEGYDADRKQKLHARRLEEFIQLEQDSKKKIIKEDELTGRQSGSLAWRTSRGETGQVSLTENKMSLLNCNEYKTHSIPVGLDCRFCLLGNAVVESSNQSYVSNVPMIRITKALPDQRGATYLSQTITLSDNLKGIEAEFVFRITNKDGGPAVNGADGFAFVIQSQGEHALGGGGCELGYGGIRNSLAIEFDTYQSSDRCADPSGNHISVQARKPPQINSAHHDYSLGHTSRIPSLQNGQWMKSKIRLLSNGTIEVGLGESGDKGYIQVLKVTNQNFLDYVDPANKKAWIGFTASTGGLSQCHDIQWISITEYRL